MDYLILAQTVFYVVFSFAIFIGSLLLAIVVFYLIKIARHLNKIAENLDSASDEVRQRLKEVIQAVSELPVVSFLFKQHKKRKKV